MRTVFSCNVAIIMAFLMGATLSHAACLPTPTGLVSWWGGDNNTLDITGSNKASAYGGVSYGAGEVGSAFNLDGASGSFLQVPYSSSLDIQGSLTISAWVYIRDTSGTRLIAGKAGSTQLYTNNGKLDFAIYGGGSPQHVVSLTTLSPSTWYHMAAVFDSSAGQSRIYINGAQDNTAPVSGLPVSDPDPYEIGGFSTYGANLNGLIDELAIFNKALTDSEIAAIHNAGGDGICKSSFPPTSGMVSWWKGDENTLDSAGANNGSRVGADTYAGGTSGKAFQLNGIDQSIAVPDGIVPRTSRYFTVNAWVYADTVAGPHYIFYGGANEGEFVLYLSDGLFNFYVNLASSNGQNVASASPVTAGSWHHVAGVRRGTAIEIWVDGELKGSQTIPDEDLKYASWNPTGFPSRIGVYHHDVNGDMYRWDGLIDEMMIYNRALSQKEILRMYDPNGPVSWWKGENNANDSIGENNGALQGAVTYSTGQTGQAFSLSSTTNDGVTFPSSADLNPTEAITMSAWIKPTATSNPWPYIIGKRTGSGAIQYSITISDRNTFTCDITGAGVNAEGGIVPLNQWSQVACTYDRNSLRLYVNGEQVASKTGNAAIATSSEPLTIGMLNGVNTRNFDGLIDEVKIYNRALSAAEVASSYGVVSWWRGDGNALDSVGDNHAVLIGSPGFEIGAVGQSFFFDGASQYAQVAAPSDLPVGAAPRSLSLWFKTPRNLATNTESALFQYGSASNGNMFGLITSANAPGRLYFYGHSADLSGTTVILPDTWYHAAVSYDGTTARLYLNGQLENSASLALNTVLDGNGLTIGYRGPGSMWQGEIDEVKMFNRALTGDEILWIYDLAPDTTPDLFSFTPQTGMPLDTLVMSNPITVSGINSPAEISIAGGEYEMNGSGTWTPSTGTVNEGDTVRVRQTSSANNSTSTSTTLSIGGVSGEFSVTTAATDDPNTLGLVAWWKGENNAYDSVGGNNGTLQGGTTFATGQVGQAFSFDGIDDYVSIPPTTGIIDNGPGTIELWFKANAVPSGALKYGYLYVQGNKGSGADLRIYLYGDGTINFVGYSGTSYEFNISKTFSDTTSWHHVAGVWSRNDTRFYLDGTLIGSDTDINMGSFTPDEITIGSGRFTDSYFNGLIDEVKIFNRALSSSEVSKLAGTYPDAFSFPSKTGVAFNTTVDSDAITVTGITQPAPISIIGGEYEINGSNNWLSTPSMVSPGSTVKVRLTSSSSYGTTTTATLNIGGREGNFSVTTIPDTEKPVVTAFSLSTAESTTMSVAVATFTATDLSGVSGYMVTSSATPPLPGAEGWSTTALPMSFTLATAGANTLYAWAKDPAGNVSDALQAAVLLKPVRLGTSTFNYYDSISAACTPASSGETIKALAVNVPGNVTITGKTLTIKGGHADGYGSQTGVTAIQGTLTVGTGSLIVDRAAVR
jgi:hypothetical protein